MCRNVLYSLLDYSLYHQKTAIWWISAKSNVLHCVYFLHLFTILPFFDGIASSPAGCIKRSGTCTKKNYWNTIRNGWDILNERTRNPLSACLLHARSAAWFAGRSDEAKTGPKCGCAVQHGWNMLKRRNYSKKICIAKYRYFYIFRKVILRSI